MMRGLASPGHFTFHDVTDLRVASDCGDSDGQVALHALSIDTITRERIRDQKICFDRPYYRWRIALNWPQGGALALAGLRSPADLKARLLTRNIDRDEGICSIGGF